MARPPVSRLSLSRLVPNLLTLAAICAGLTSIRFAVEGRIDHAIGLIILAAVLDGMDGRLARMLKSESAIGAELDSLADFLNFGVATGLLVFFTLLHEETSLGWIASLIYVICCVMRLARFNVGSKTPDPDAIPGYFTGVPSPAGAMLALMPLIFDRAFPGITSPSGVLVALWLIFVGWLLISHIPTPSLKLVRLRRDRMHYIFVGMIAAGAILFTWPWHALLALNVLYLGVVLWSFTRRQRRSAKRRPDET